LTKLVKDAFSIETEVDFSEKELLEIISCLTLKDEIESGYSDKFHLHHEENIVKHVNHILSSKISGYKKEKSFTIYFTHDVDWVKINTPLSYLKSGLSGTLRKIKWFSFSELYHRRNLIRFTDELIAFEKIHGFHSIFFLPSSNYDPFNRYGSRVDLNDKTSKDFFQMLLSNNVGIGLHGSYHARYKNSYAEEAKKLAEALNREITMHRNHYLNFDPANLWQQMENAGIRYDFSIGYIYDQGLRTTLPFSFKGLDVLQNRISNVTGIPLLFMDLPDTLTDKEKTIREFRENIQILKTYNGTASILFHAENLCLYPELFELYSQIIDICKSEGAVINPELK